MNQGTETKKDYVTEAFAVIKKLDDDAKKRLIVKITTSQIRKILFLVNKISNTMDVHLLKNGKVETINEELYQLLLNLKVKCIYSAAKYEKKIQGQILFPVKKFMDEAHIIEKIDAILKTRELHQLKEFIYYMEALVAYHKFFGGKEE